MDFIKGIYRDVLKRTGEPPVDTGYKSNSIQPDCGKFFSALFNKFFTPPIGIEYLIVGGPYNANDASILYANADKNLFASRFRDRIARYFARPGLTPPTVIAGNSSSQIMSAQCDNIDNRYWVCAVMLTSTDIRFDPTILPPASPVTNQLKIDFTFQKTDLTKFIVSDPSPSETPWSPPFKEFSLLGIQYLPTGYQPASLFQINYVAQEGIYVKDQNVSLDRSILLNFPPQQI